MANCCLRRSCCHSYIPQCLLDRRERGQTAAAGERGDVDGRGRRGIAPVIHTIDLDGTERWFDLSGRQLQGKPARKGVYINKGKKAVIK